MYYFTADLHFASKETLERENRPFKTNEEFYKYVIDNFCECGRNDIIYILGDYVTHCNNSNVDMETLKAMFQLLKPVKAEIRLVVGNNEERIIKDLFQNDFLKFSKFCTQYNVKVLQEDYISFGRYDFYLNHYPRKHKDGYVNLFGHVHRATGLWKPYGLNVGCDLNHFRLFSEAEILRLLEMKNMYWDNDPDVLN